MIIEIHISKTCYPTPPTIYLFYLFYTSNIIYRCYGHSIGGWSWEHGTMAICYALDSCRTRPWSQPVTPVTESRGDLGPRQSPGLLSQCWQQFQYANGGCDANVCSSFVFPLGKHNELKRNVTKIALLEIWRWSWKHWFHPQKHPNSGQWGTWRVFFFKKMHICTHAYCQTWDYKHLIGA